MKENGRRALLELMHRVILHARAKAWGCARLRVRLRGRNEAEIADLMNVIHNIPQFLHRSEGWDDEFFKKGFLDVYDRKWAGQSGLRLRETYESLLASSNEGA